MRMPELDGIGLLEAVRAAYPRHLGHHAHRHERDHHRGRLPPHRAPPISCSSPSRSGELQARVARVLEKRALVLQNRYYQQNLERQVHEQAQRIQELFLQGVQMLARALEAKDAYTRGHSIRVSQYAVGTAPAARIRRRRASTASGWAGSCTTSGRSARARRCCTSPGTLTDEEFRQITEHPALGERMLLPLAQESPDVLRIVRSHHERLDGRGFPDGLRGEKIPIEARIVAVADAFDAMTTERPYRDSRPPDAARRGAAPRGRTQLDPAAVEAFVAAFPDPADAAPLRLVARRGPRRLAASPSALARTAGFPFSASCVRAVAASWR